MAEAKLNFDEATLDTTSNLYLLYDRLYQGMVAANEVDAPTYPSADELLVHDANGNVKFDSNGNPIIDSVKSIQVEQMAAAYSDILMKNSAYLFASAITSVVSGNGSGGGAAQAGFISRSGDSMSGLLSAWYGFEAGVDGNKILEVTIDSSDNQWTKVYGGLQVSKDAEISGLLKLGQGIAFDGQKTIYYDNSKLFIAHSDITLKGEVTVDGTFSLGDVKIGKNGIFWDDHEFYHAGNSNKSDVDWAMHDASVFGDLSVQGEASIQGFLKALNGFSLGALGNKLLYTETTSSINSDGDAVESSQIVLESDLRIINSHGIKFGDDYIVNVRNSNVVSFSAPGMIMNLGDSDNGKQTQKISLQSDIWDYSNTFKIISKEGTGNFPNGLRAQCAVNSTSVLETYRVDQDNVGVLFEKQIRFGSTGGPAIFQDPTTGRLNIVMPYVNGAVEGHPTEELTFNTYYAQTTSPFRDLSLPWSATLHFFSDAEFFAFDKPVEAEYFAIKSDRFYTRLIENALFFGDGKFIEGVADGLRFAGNGYFDSNVSSPSFASGFAGYGWAVKDEITNGGYHATFDSLTIRKKMRVYELEVQKISCTNGSLWVSDFCSGDEVIELY